MQGAHGAFATAPQRRDVASEPGTARMRAHPHVASVGETSYAQDSRKRLLSGSFLPHIMSHATIRISATCRSSASSKAFGYFRLLALSLARNPSVAFLDSGLGG